MKRTLRALGGIALAALPLAACFDQSPEPLSAQDHNASERDGIGIARQALGTGPITVDIRRSLAVTDVAIVSQFTLADVLNQLAGQSGIAGLTGVDLWKQLWDTQNPNPGLTNGPHCDDATLLNGFPYPCRTAEGAQASDPVTSMGRYQAIGLFNRFDLAPADGSDCGEHRIVFGKTQGPGRNFVIFEAVLPNPSPTLGLEGCRPVADLWAALSTENDPAVRAANLHAFYFDGLPGFMPVVHIDNYGNGGPGRKTGQVRTNQFIQSPWNLREFSLRKVTLASGPALHFLPDTVKTNPFGRLFSDTSTHPKRAAFQAFFPSQVAALAQNDINLFSYAVPDEFNAVESVSQAPSINAYSQQFAPNGAFAGSIQAELTAIGSTLTPANIVARAEALSCGGCHDLSNNKNLGGGLTFPSSAGFVHASEFTENGPEGQRFVLSSALVNVFLPHRKAILEDYLNQPVTCAHDVCEVGGALDSTCNACANTVCNADSFCCTSSWDATCVGEAVSLCNLTCPAPPPSCPHDVCDEGDPLDAACNACTADVCYADSYCCDMAWDSACVQQAQNLCGVTCY